MAILLDSFYNEQRGPRRFWYRRCGHLTSDLALVELFEFAEELRLRREWIQAKSVIHFDLTDPEYELAVELGAQVVTSRELVQRALRLTPRGFGRLISPEELDLLVPLATRNWSRKR